MHMEPIQLDKALDLASTAPVNLDALFAGIIVRCLRLINITVLQQSIPPFPKRYHRPESSTLRTKLRYISNDIDSPFIPLRIIRLHFIV